MILLGVSYGKNIVAICEMDGSVLWKHDTAGPQRGHTGHHDIHLLDNGNILFHDTWTKTQEITLDRKVVWEYESARENGNEGRRVDVHAFKRYADGSTMIAESGVGRFLHVAKDGKKIKESIRAKACTYVRTYVPTSVYGAPTYVCTHTRAYVHTSVRT